MNKHGFTMIELLAVIIILGLLAAVGTIAYATVMNKSSNQAFERYRDSMHAEAVYYVANNVNNITWSSNKARIPLATLKMEAINNPKDDSDLCLNSYVDVTRTRNTSSKVLSITYNVCLVCNDFNECKEYEN